MKPFKERSTFWKIGESATSSSSESNEIYLRKQTTAEQWQSSSIKEPITEEAIILPVNHKNTDLSRNHQEENSKKNGTRRHYENKNIAVPLQNPPEKRAVFVIVSGDNIFEKEIDLFGTEAPTVVSDLFPLPTMGRTLTPTTVPSRTSQDTESSQTNKKLSYETEQTALTLVTMDSLNLLAAENKLVEKQSFEKSGITVAHSPLVKSAIPKGVQSKAEAFMEPPYLQGPQSSAMTRTTVESVKTSDQQPNPSAPSNENLHMPSRRQIRLAASENNSLLEDTLKRHVIELKIDRDDFKPPAFRKNESILAVSNTSEGYMKSQNGGKILEGYFTTQSKEGTENFGAASNHGNGEPNQVTKVYLIEFNRSYSSETKGEILQSDSSIVQPTSKIKYIEKSFQRNGKVKNFNPSFIYTKQNKNLTYSRIMQQIEDTNEQMTERNIISHQMKNVPKTKYSDLFKMALQAPLPDDFHLKEINTDLINHPLTMTNRANRVSGLKEIRYPIFKAKSQIQDHKGNYKTKLSVDKMRTDLKLKSIEKSEKNVGQKSQDIELSMDIRNYGTVHAPKIEFTDEWPSNWKNISLSEKPQDGFSRSPNAPENKIALRRPKSKLNPEAISEKLIARQTVSPVRERYAPDPNDMHVSKMDKRDTKQQKKEIPRSHFFEYAQSDKKDSLKNKSGMKKANMAKDDINHNPSTKLSWKIQEAASDSELMDNKPSPIHLTYPNWRLQKVSRNKSGTEEFIHSPYNIHNQTPQHPVPKNLFKSEHPIRQFKFDSLQESKDKIAVNNETKLNTDQINNSDQEWKSEKAHDVKTPNLFPSWGNSEGEFSKASSENETPMAHELLKPNVFDNYATLFTTPNGGAPGDYTNETNFERSNDLENIYLGAHSGEEENSLQVPFDGVSQTSSILSGSHERILIEPSVQQQENAYLNPFTGQKSDTHSAQKRKLNNRESGSLSEQYVLEYYGWANDVPKVHDILAPLSKKGNIAEQSLAVNARDSLFLLDRPDKSLQYDSSAPEFSFGRQNLAKLTDHQVKHYSLPSMFHGSDSIIPQNQPLGERDKSFLFEEAQSSFESTIDEDDNTNTQVKSTAEEMIMEHKKKPFDVVGKAFGRKEADYFLGQVRDDTEEKLHTSRVFDRDTKATSKQSSSIRTSERGILRMPHGSAKASNEVKSVVSKMSPQHKSKHWPAWQKPVAFPQSNLPPFFWNTETTRNVLPSDYFKDPPNALSRQASKRQNSVKPLPLTMQAVLLPMTNRQLGIIPACMIMVAYFILLLVIGVAAILIARKKRSKKYTRRFLYTMILASRLREESQRLRRSRALEVQIDLETNLLPYVILQKKYLAEDVFQNLRSAINKFSEYQSMIAVYEKIKKSGDPQKLDTVAALLTDFFRKERDESVQKAKMIKLIAESQTN
uniref:Uncharacterized protein n=1 Tax=Schistocephalus solidus TaxID=70667 RepID=A0A0X3NXH5_SCHSO